MHEFEFPAERIVTLGQRVMNTFNFLNHNILKSFLTRLKKISKMFPTERRLIEVFRFKYLFYPTPVSVFLIRKLPLLFEFKFYFMKFVFRFDLKCYERTYPFTIIMVI